MAARGSLIFFLINSLPSLDRTYYFSMATFVAILQKGVTLELLSSSATLSPSACT